jgi:hypothetical protein
MDQEPAVVVDGSGALAGEVAVQLRRCAVRVRAGAQAADAAEVAAGAGSAPPALVVLARGGPVPWWAGAPWQSRDVPHLPVEALAGVTVGPLVVPGRSACLCCVAGAGVRPSLRPAPDTDRAAVVLAAAVVTVTTLAVLRGDHDLAGISTEIGPRARTVRHRLWTSRPECRCASGTMTG